MSDAAALHRGKVEAVIAQLRAHTGSRPISFRKRAVSHQVPKPHDLSYRDDTIDLRPLDAILEIDPEGMTATVEPGVTFAALVDALLPLGLLPLVVPELETITAGGAVTGCSLESMSFECGGFHDTCLAYEVITANGDVIECTPNGDEALLFQMMHGSFGTLGILSKLTFRLVRAAPYVHLRHDRFEDVAGYRAAIERHAAAHDIDFMDGIIHAPNELVLSLGTFAREAPHTSHYDWTRVYWKSTHERREDWLATRDYLFRYDRGVTNVHPKSPLGRLVFGRVLGSARLLRAASVLHRFLPARPTVTVDLFIPISRFGDFIDWYDRTIGHYPLWCVPYRRVHDYEWLAPSFYADLHDTMFVDLAIYGLEQPAGRNLYREIEEELPRVGGVKTLISYNYYDEKTFWSIFNKASYDAVKQRTDPANLFRDLYAKTVLAPRGLET